VLIIQRWQIKHLVTVNLQRYAEKLARDYVSFAKLRLLARKLQISLIRTAEQKFRYFRKVHKAIVQIASIQPELAISHKVSIMQELRLFGRQRYLKQQQSRRIFQVLDKKVKGYRRDLVKSVHVYAETVHINQNLKALVR